MTVHKDLANGRWQTLTLAAQLGNAGSEFLRAQTWLGKGDLERNAAAFDRFLELMDLTVSDPRWSGSRRRELARVREQAKEELDGRERKTPSLQNYFDQFALLARAGK